MLGWHEFAQRCAGQMTIAAQPAFGFRHIAHADISAPIFASHAARFWAKGFEAPGSCRWQTAFRRFSSDIAFGDTNERRARPQSLQCAYIQRSPEHHEPRAATI